MDPAKVPPTPEENTERGARPFLVLPLRFGQPFELRREILRPGETATSALEAEPHIEAALAHREREVRSLAKKLEGLNQSAESAAHSSARHELARLICGPENQHAVPLISDLLTSAQCHIDPKNPYQLIVTFEPDRWTKFAKLFFSTPMRGMNKGVISMRPQGEHFEVDAHEGAHARWGCERPQIDAARSRLERTASKDSAQRDALETLLFDELVARSVGYTAEARQGKPSVAAGEHWKDAADKVVHGYLERKRLQVFEATPERYKEGTTERAELERTVHRIGVLLDKLEAAGVPPEVLHRIVLYSRNSDELLRDWQHVSKQDLANLESHIAPELWATLDPRVRAQLMKSSNLDKPLKRVTADAGSVCALTLIRGLCHGEYEPHKLHHLAPNIPLTGVNIGETLGVPTEMLTVRTDQVGAVGAFGIDAVRMRLELGLLNIAERQLTRVFASAIASRAPQASAWLMKHGVGKLAGPAFALAAGYSAYNDIDLFEASSGEVACRGAGAVLEGAITGIPAGPVGVVGGATIAAAGAFGSAMQRLAEHEKNLEAAIEERGVVLTIQRAMRGFVKADSQPGNECTPAARAYARRAGEAHFLVRLEQVSPSLAKELSIADLVTVYRRISTLERTLSGLPEAKAELLLQVEALALEQEKKAHVTAKQLLSLVPVLKESNELMEQLLTFYTRAYVVETRSKAGPGAVAIRDELSELEIEFQELQKKGERLDRQQDFLKSRLPLLPSMLHNPLAYNLLQQKAPTLLRSDAALGNIREAEHATLMDDSVRPLQIAVLKAIRERVTDSGRRQIDEEIKRRSKLPIPPGVMRHLLVEADEMSEPSLAHRGDSLKNIEKAIELRRTGELSSVSDALLRGESRFANTRVLTNALGSVHGEKLAERLVELANTLAPGSNAATLLTGPERAALLSALARDYVGQRQAEAKLLPDAKLFDQKLTSEDCEQLALRRYALSSFGRSPSRMAYIFSSMQESEFQDTAKPRPKLASEEKLREQDRILDELIRNGLRPILRPAGDPSAR